MRIKKISVRNLFGLFTHSIPLNMDEHITIIIGPNGFGKTVLLKMLNALFKSDYNIFAEIPFDEFSIEFDDGGVLSAKIDTDEYTQAKINSLSIRWTREPSSKKLLGKILILMYKNGKSTHTHKIDLWRIEEVPFITRYLERRGDISRCGPNSWLQKSTGDILSFEELCNKYDYVIGNIDKNTLNCFRSPDWLADIKSSIDITFIDTHRLFKVEIYGEDPKTSEPSVISYSKELAKAIQNKLTEYAALSQSLDRTFPVRLVESSKSSELTIDELRRNLLNLEQKRSKLITAGLLDREKDIDFAALGEKINENNINVLSVYVKDVNNKLKVFDEINNKIDLLVNIINRRFLYKNMSINRRDGFVFISETGENLSSSNLSSGEQHELVMIYELLFKVMSHSLILIDEPEISLHVAWQQQFLKDLQEITRLVGFDVLIATHSPQIIHNLWPLTVELKHPEKR